MPKTSKKLLETPSAQAGAVPLADFAELSALQAADKKFSSQRLVSALKTRGGQNEEAYENPVGEAFQELATRQLHSSTENELYPFEVDGDLLKFKKAKADADKDFLYLFLLIATRLNMRDNKLQGGLDGTDVFEWLSLEVAKRYWGASAADKARGARVKGTVFGASRAKWRSVGDDNAEVGIGKFKKAVDDLCRAMREGGCFSPKDAKQKVTAKDDKLDIVVWKEFADIRPGKLIGFGQSKTGDHWNLELPRLNPDTFMKRWLREFSLVPPVRLFFLADRVVDDWKNRGYEAGIMFDRCRILDYADEVPNDVLSKCARWTRAVLKVNGLSW
jgi:hypothetical protein